MGLDSLPAKIWFTMSVFMILFKYNLNRVKRFNDFREEYKIPFTLLNKPVGNGSFFWSRYSSSITAR
jgi:hypothetical protein